jgi:hypothetical protein
VRIVQIANKTPIYARRGRRRGDEDRRQLLWHDVVWLGLMDRARARAIAGSSLV